MAKLFDELKTKNLNGFNGPKLHFWRTKKILRLPQLPFEHLVIPPEAMPPLIQILGGGIASARKRTALLGAALTPILSLAEGQLSYAALAGITIARTAMNFSRIPPTSGWFHEAIGKILQEHLERGSFPAGTAFAYGKKGNYEEITSSDELAKRLKRMTHFAVDNKGGIVLARHPLHEKPNNLSAGEWARLLPHLVLWNQIFQRFRGQLQKPRRTVRQEVPKISPFAKPVHTGLLGFSNASARK